VSTASDAPAETDLNENVAGSKNGFVHPPGSVIGLIMRYLTAAPRKRRITIPSPAAIIVLVLALDSIPLRFMPVNNMVKNTAYTANGISGMKFIEALLIQITQIMGFIT
jgi:hypothetical protein